MTVVNTLIQTTLSLCSLRVTIPNHSHTFPNPLPGSYRGHRSALQLLSLLKHLNQHTGEEGDKQLRMERSREETRWAAVNSSKPQYHRKKPFFLSFCLVLFEVINTAVPAEIRMFTGYTWHSEDKTPSFQAARGLMEPRETILPLWINL